MVNPFLFMNAELLDAHTEEPVHGNQTIGSTSSPIHSIKDSDGESRSAYCFIDAKLKLTPAQ